MSKWILVLAAAVGVFVAVKSCTPGFSKASAAPFQGTWVVSEESEVSGNRVTQTLEVAASGPQFRLAGQVEEQAFNQPPEAYRVERVFDGTTLYEKTVVPLEPGQPEEAFPAVASQPTEAALARLRFWTRTFTGEAGAGGLVAGRETKLYAARSTEKHQEISVQAWVDAETGIVLKSNVSVYSPQVGMTVSKVTEECQEIRFGPVTDSVFAPPQ